MNACSPVGKAWHISWYILFSTQFRIQIIDLSLSDNTWLRPVSDRVSDWQSTFDFLNWNSIRNTSCRAKINICICRNMIHDMSRILEYSECYWCDVPGESCVVQSHRCSFPFSSGESEHFSCQPSNSSESSGTEYCYSQVKQGPTVNNHLHSLLRLGRDTSTGSVTKDATKTTEVSRPR